MPYLTTQEKKRLDRRLVRLPVLSSPGELAYVQTRIWLHYGGPGKWRFFLFADIVGGTILALLEFWRRVVCPYEDKKREENGDVYE